MQTNNIYLTVNMNVMNRIILFLFVLLLFACKGESQNKSKKIGGPCEGCEAIYEYGNKILKPVDTLPQFNVLPYPIRISGTVYESDGKTPASNIILYVYQTDDKGKYPLKMDSKGWERRHGYLRGWMKTDASGNYEFYTSRPASYPNSTVPQHIHVTVNEPDKNEYYIEDFYFEDDPHITSAILNRKRSRGGSGVLSLVKVGSLQVAKRDIILGLNIPNY
jgi:protocatechuate 3,4-dioxygenase beta subunit